MSGKENKFEIYGEEVIDKEAKQFGSGAHVTVPKQWIGENVKIVRVSDKHQNE
jgi:putative transposon-encoded protein